MKRYLEQLISDMRASARNVPDEDLRVFFGNTFDDEELPFSEKFIYGPRRKISDIVGIPSISFPPEHLLTENQLEILAIEMEYLLKAFYFYPEFPNGIPGRLRYRQLLRVWDDEHVFLANGEIPLEFCDYNESNCPFPGYCDICSNIKVITGESDEETEEVEDFIEMKYDPDSYYEVEDDSGENEIFNLFLPGRDGRFITSIYFYCDQWCQRCQFKNRCRHYYNEKKRHGRLVHHEPTRKEFIDDIQCIREKTRYYIDREIRKRGIELREIDYKAYKRIQEEIKKHPLVKAAEKYSLMVSEWIYNNRKDMKNKLDCRVNQEEHKLLFNDLKVVHWDHTMIPIKICRAIQGLIDNEESFVVEEATGAAKVALILTDRSSDAWENIIASFYDKEVEIFQIINQLKRLREEILIDFPNAPKFHRPGFDD
jgi:hypothetical protein